MLTFANCTSWCLFSFVRILLVPACGETRTRAPSCARSLSTNGWPSAAEAAAAAARLPLPHGWSPAVVLLQRSWRPAAVTVRSWTPSAVVFLKCSRQEVAAALLLLLLRHSWHSAAATVIQLPWKRMWQWTAAAAVDRLWRRWRRAAARFILRRQRAHLRSSWEKRKMRKRQSKSSSKVDHNSFNQQYLGQLFSKWSS